MQERIISLNFAGSQSLPPTGGSLLHFYWKNLFSECKKSSRRNEDGESGRKLAWEGVRVLRKQNKCIRQGNLKKASGA